jgi:hypothetical protein
MGENIQGDLGNGPEVIEHRHAVVLTVLTIILRFRGA